MYTPVTTQHLEFYEASVLRCILLKSRGQEKQRQREGVPLKGVPQLLQNLRLQAEHDNFAN